MLKNKDTGDVYFVIVFALVEIGKEEVEQGKGDEDGFGGVD